MIKNNIQEILDIKGISINMLAKALGREYSGVHRLVNRDSLDTTPLATLIEISNYLDVDIKKLYEGDYKMKLIEMDHGEEKVLIEGSLEEIVGYLRENEDIINWVQDEDPEMELPNLDDVETIGDLQAELSKVDLDWWALVVEEQNANEIEECLEILRDENLLGHIGEQILESPELFGETLEEMETYFEGKDRDEILDILSTSSLVGSDDNIAIQEWVAEIEIKNLREV